MRFIEEPDCLDTNRWRWPLKLYWARLLDGASRIRLYQKPGVEYNMSNLENFVYQQAGNAISAMMEIVGEEQFKKGLQSRGTQQNPKYKALIEQYGRKDRYGAAKGK